MSQIPTFGKDTNHFLNKLKVMGTFPDGAILVTIDVVGLHPHISLDEDLTAVIEKLLTTDATQKFPQMMSLIKRS